jgi:hypothetical protein
MMLKIPLNPPLQMGKPVFPPPFEKGGREGFIHFFEQATTQDPDNSLIRVISKF